MAETPTVAVSPMTPTVLSPIDQHGRPTTSQGPSPGPSPLSDRPVPAPINTTRSPPSAFPGTLPNRAPGVSTGKAKKVMDWFRKKSIVDGDEVSMGSSTASPAPQVVVTGDRELSHVPASAAGPPPSAWAGQQPQQQPSSAAFTAATNGAGLLHPPASAATTQATSASAGNTPVTASRPNVPVASTFNRNALRVHEGPVDPGAVSSGSPDQVYAQVLEALRGMGVTISPETLYKAQCVRPAKKKEGRQSGLAAFSITGLGGSSGVCIGVKLVSFVLH